MMFKISVVHIPNRHIALVYSYKLFHYIISYKLQVNSTLLSFDVANFPITC